MNHEQIEGVLGIKSTSLKNWIRGNVDRHPVVGVLPPGVCEGDTVVMRGRWEDRGYGLQFNFRECQSVRPKGVNGVKRYLAQNFKWIGPAIAEEIIRRFGEGFFDIVESDHQRLTEIRGITPQRADEIHAAWSEKKADKEAGLFFATCGISPAFQNRIQAAFQKMPIAQLIETIKANPYQMVERVDGIGFVTADKIARRLDFDTASPFRIRAGIFHALYEAAESDGHCYLPAQALLKAAADLLCVSPEMVAHELGVLLADDKIGCFLRDHISLPRFLSAENRVAARIKAIAKRTVARVMATIPNEEWEWLTPKQREAVQCAIASNLMVLTGLPGTGKTSSLKAIVKAFGKLSIALCAPTGKAAKRMSQQIGREAQTIHRLLQYHPEEGFRVNHDNPLDVDVVIADEMSMACIELADALLDAIDPERTTLILVGDVNQLPSVGPGRILNDVIASGVCPVIHLTEILRQAEASTIVKNAHAINAGHDLIPDNVKEFFFASTDDTGLIVDWIGKTLEVMPQKFGLDPVRDVQVLCPANVSSIGADALNPYLSRLLNPDGAAIKGSSLKVGDKTMQRKNNYKRLVFGDEGRSKFLSMVAADSNLKWTNAVSVEFIFNTGGCDFGAFNGDGGVIESFFPNVGLMLVAFDDGIYSLYRVSEAEEELIRSFAISIHKSQGSEYPAVIIPIHTTNYLMLQRSLLYTAITRAARYLVLIGSPKAVRIAIANNKVTERFTNLRTLLEAPE